MIGEHIKEHAILGVRPVDFSAYVPKYDLYSTPTISIDSHARLLYESGGTKSVDYNQWELWCFNSLAVSWQHRKMYAYNNNIGDVETVDWNNGYLSRYQNGLHSLSWNDSCLYGSDGLATSLDWANRTLYASDGTTAMLKYDFASGLYAGGSPTGLIDLTSGVLKSYITSSPVNVLDFYNRKLYDYQGSLVASFNEQARFWGGSDGGSGYYYWLDLNNATLGDPNGTKINWSIHLLYANSNVLSLDWNNRVFYASDGMTAVLKYDSADGLYGGAGPNGFIDLATCMLSSYTGSKVNSIDYLNRILYDANGNQIADFSGVNNYGFQCSTLEVDNIFPSSNSSISFGSGGDVDIFFKDAYAGGMGSGGGLISFSSADRKLYDINGVAILDWSNNTNGGLLSGNGTYGIDFNNACLVDAATSSVDWHNHLLYHTSSPDGSLDYGVTVNWQSHQLLEANSSYVSVLSLDWKLRTLHDGLGTEVVAWGDGTYALKVTGTSYLNGAIQTPSMPTADPADGTGTLWYDTTTNLVYRGT